MRHHGINLVSDATIQRIDVIRTALPVALRHRGVPIDRQRVPDGWRLKCKRWPASWTEPDSYQIECWHQSCADGTFVRIEPQTDGWQVTAGRHLSETVLDETVVSTIDDAVDVAIQRMERISAGRPMDTIVHQPEPVAHPLRE